MKGFALLFVVVALASCGSSRVVSDRATGVNLSDAARVYTLVNLHPDEKLSKLYAVNYQLSGLIPVCSEVQFEKVGKKRLVFKVSQTGKTYTYDHYRALPETFEEHLSKVFGASCDREKIASLSQLDRDGIQSGTVSVGMTKPGVIYAIGYPPGHATPSLEMNEWKYWVNRFSTMLVVFDATGHVSNIER